MRHHLAIMLVVLAMTAPAFALPIQLDFGSGGVVQSGWTEFKISSNPLALGGGVTAAFQNIGIVEERDRGSAGAAAGLGLDNLLRDFLFSNGTGIDNRFKITGLADGDYNVTVYSHDSDYARTYSHVINGQTVTFGPATGPNLDEVCDTVAVTLSSGAANNEIQIYSPSSSYLFLLSGVVVEQQAPVPEPATLALVALGGSALFLRRRKA